MQSCQHDLFVHIVKIDTVLITCCVVLLMLTGHEPWITALLRICDSERGFRADQSWIHHAMPTSKSLRYFLGS